MRAERLSCFSDAVIAIVLTIMVLELKVPHDVTLAALRPLWPVFLSYLLSFVYIGIYWINHHHLLHERSVDGAVLWANLHLLFWLSLLPFATGWMGQNHFAPLPTAVYGMILLAAALAYRLLQRVLARAGGETHRARRSDRWDWKTRLSISLYLAGIGAAVLDPALGQLCFVVGAAWWVWPDRRIPPATVSR